VSAVSVAIALGSNLGDREQFFRDAVRRLALFISDLEVSPSFETEPVGVGEQPPFLNAAIAGRCSLEADQLLGRMLEIEAACGRVRLQPGAARTLDLDLILYGDAIIDRPGLVVPHPRFRTRRFVLEPLAIVAGTWRDPQSGLSVVELLAGLPD
jgi:2-amino-4-hydroxy-6-hydroxymethyldihydropteridine diphosphokinase